MTPPTSSLPTHLEAHLGQIESGWGADDGDAERFRVVSYAGPVCGGVPLSTLGLSRHLLAAQASGRQLRQELIMLVPSHASARAAAILDQIATEALESGTAVVRGTVIGPRGNLFAGTEMEAIYVAAPVYLPDDFATFHGDAYDVIIPWLIPITQSEAEFVRLNGWAAFESQLIVFDPDLVQIDRSAIL